MANLSILDTGYVTPTNTGTRLGATSMANAGTAIDLKAVEFKPSASQGVDSTPSIGVYGAGDAIDSVGVEGNVATINAVTFSLAGMLDLTKTADQDLVLPLITLARTKGYKVLYYDSSSDDKERQLVYQLATDTFTAGESSAFGVTEGLKHLNIRIMSCDFIQVAGKNVWKYNLSGIVIKKETSAL
tara:strand:- start:172 stop:729 length:558 start_codon:yes stop_codon:yes gene_type:complete